uniref:DUF4283 domain-containing protein n=1 Tax=Heterorhabditis bacteriophora TaxID=37862 RepID=A0A1I7X7Q1_HETBA
MVMFDGISCNGGRVWIVKTISYIGYTLAQRNNCWPTQAYFIDDLKPLPRKQQPYLGHSVILWSDKLSDQVTTLIGHIRRSNGDDFNMVFGGIVVTEWEHSGMIRKFRAIAVVENSIWKDYKEEHWRAMAVNLNCHNWHEVGENSSPLDHRQQLDFHVVPNNEVTCTPSAYIGLSQES